MPIYQIKVSGELDTRWTSWLQILEKTTELDDHGKPITILTGPIADQSELRGLLIKVWDLNLELISLNRVDKDRPDERGSP